MVKKTGLSKPLGLSSVLADIFGVSKDAKLSKVEVVKKLWTHIKDNKLQDMENKRLVTPDVKMIEIFGEEKIKAFGMVKYLKDHLIDKWFCPWNSLS